MKTERALKRELDEFADSPLPFLCNGSSGVRMDLSFRSDSSASLNGFDDVVSPTDTDEGRLSRALQTWMPDYTIKSLVPREKPPVEPVFSGRLGKERPALGKKNGKNVSYGKASSGRRCKTAPVRRVPSDESIATNISLLTCSTYDSKHFISFDVKDDAALITPRRRKRKVASRASTQASEEPTVSKWAELSMKRSGILSRLTRMRTEYGIIGGADMSGDSEAFQLFDKDEQEAVYQAGLSSGIKYVSKARLKRSGSSSKLNSSSNTTNTRQHPKPVKRVLSASAKRGFGKTLDIEELKRERMNRLIALEQERLQLEREKRKGRRGALMRRQSSQSFTGSLPGTQSSPPATVAPSVSGVSQSAHSSDNRPYSSSDRSEQGTGEEKVSVWKGDREILEIDLKRELTQHVKQKITTTRTALKRATGMGDTNEQTQLLGKVEEFPKHIEEDFCHKPKIIQRMRISPHLSNVIHDDIQVRMGRPRYHEIRVSDLEQWNKGQALNRAHRNLKVFNWLHSLRESEFQTNVQTDIQDEIPDLEMDLELLHVEAADEPDVKPLYKAYEVRIL